MTAQRSKHALFLLSVAALAILAGCKPDDSDKAQRQAGDDQTISATQLFKIAHIKPSWAGSYLSSRIAQSRFDWDRAETFLAQTQTERPDNILLDRRLMLLAMGSGDYAAALKQAKALAETPDDSGLTRLVLMLDPMRGNDYTAARTQLDGLPDSSLVRFIKPLLTAWLDAGTNKVDFAALRKSNLYFYHMILLADYTNQIDQVTSQSLLMSGREHLTAVSAERIGDIFLRHKKFELAHAMYQATQLLNPQTTGITAKLKASADKTTDLPAGIVLTPPVADVRDGLALAFFDMATGFYNEQSLESAQLFTQMALTLAPDMPEARLLLGNLLAQNKRLDAAITAYRQIPQSSPRYKAVQQEIAQLLVELNRDDEAITTLKSMVDQTPDVSEKIDYLLQMGDIYREDEKYKDALNFYDRAAGLLDNKIDESHWEILYARGMTLERLKQWDRAEKDLLSALDFRPEHPYLLNYIGYSWADQGINLPRALTLLNKAVALVPDDGYVTDSLGWAYFKAEAYDKAVTYLERAVELLPYDPTLNDHLGDAYAKVDRRREAEFQWRRAYNYSEDPTARKKIGEKLHLPDEQASAQNGTTTE